MSRAGTRGLFVLLVALTGCGGHSSGSTGPTSNTTTAVGLDFGSNTPHTVSAFGDSITQGVLELRRIGVRLETSQNYPAVLQSMLQRLDPAWRVVNRGLGGEHVEDGASRIRDVLAADRPGFILIMEGTNNASRCDDAAFIVDRLRVMVEHARANRTIPLLGTIPPNFRSPSCAQDVIDEANVLIRQVAAAEGIVLAEIFEGMNDRQLFGLAPDRDPLHPNEQGYRVMAGIWNTALSRAMSGGTAVAQRRRGR